LRDWQRTFKWLDRSGLTLYLLQRLKSINATQLLPPPVLTRFEQNLADNRRRVDYLASEFRSLNERFDHAGLKYAAIKGFSLVPAYCPNAVLRAPSDLDYLVEHKSLPVAQRVLEEAGYCLQRFSDIEFKYGRPSSKIPTVSDDPFSRETEPSVDLHLTFWNWKLNRVPLNEPEFRLDQTIEHDWQGLPFPVLNDDDAFVLQILHIFQHTLEGWVKLSSLLEMGYFLKARRSHTHFWNRVNVRVGEVPYLAEFAAVVMGLAKRAFAAPMPLVAAKWTQCVRPSARLWLQNYGRRWAIEEHPYDSSSLLSATKLSVFLHQQFVPDPTVRKQITQQRLLPWKRPAALSTDNAAATSLTARQLQSWSVLQRLISDLGSSSRYVLELARWIRLHRLAGAHKSHQPASASTCDLSHQELLPTHRQ